MKRKKVEKVISALKDRIGHPYRNLDMSQQPQAISQRIMLNCIKVRRHFQISSIVMALCHWQCT